MRYAQHPVDADGWTEWVRPRQPGYRIACCDCGLVHDMQFRRAADGAIEFRARRNERSTGQKRRHRRLIPATC